MTILKNRRNFFLIIIILTLNLLSDSNTPFIANATNAENEIVIPQYEFLDFDTVRFYGTTNELTKSVSSYMFNPGYSDYTGANLTKENSFSLLFSMDEVTVSNKTFSFTKRFTSNDESGWYKIIIGFDDIQLSDSISSTTFYYANQQTRNIILNEINTSDVNNLYYTILKYNNKTYTDQNGNIQNGFPILKINTEEYANNIETISRIIIDNRSKSPNGVFKSLNELIQSYYASASIIAFNSATALNINDIIERYAKELGLDIGEDYHNNKKNAGELLLACNNFTSTDDIVKHFNVSLAIACVNGTSRNMLPDVISKYNSFLQLDLNSYYYSNKIEVCKALYNQNFSSVADVKQAFDKQINDLKNKSEQSAAGSKGGGNGSVIIPTKSVILEPQPLSQTETESMLIKFNDISSVQWAKESIEALTRLGVVNGVSKTEFKPFDYVTREQFAKMIINTLGIPLTNSQLSFDDVDSNEWYYQYITTAYSSGIINGYDESQFGVSFPITREQMAAIVYRAIINTNISEQNLDGVPSFTDAAEIADYAFHAVYFLQKKAIITGTYEGAFYPNEYATRAETAKILYNLINFKNSEVAK